MSEAHVEVEREREDIINMSSLSLSLDMILLVIDCATKLEESPVFPGLVCPACPLIIVDTTIFIVFWRFFRINYDNSYITTKIAYLLYSKNAYRGEAKACKSQRYMIANI